MKRRKGEIATLLMIGAVVVMGITAVISSLTQNNTQSTSSRASINESCAVGETKCGTSSSFTCCNNATQTCNYTTHICMPKSTPIPTIPAGNPTCVKTSCSTVDPTFKKGYYQYNEVADKSYKTGCSGTALSANALWSYCQSLNPPPTVPPTVNTPTVVPTIGGGGPPTGGWTQSCCFVYPDGPQNDRYGCDPGVKYIRVYATAAARNANQMDTPCEKTVGYGAERFFECSQTSDACETPHAEPTTPLGNNTGGTCEVGGLSIPNDGKVHCLPDESNRYARCNGSIFTCSLGKSCNEGVGPNGDAQCSVIGVTGGVGIPVPTIPHSVTPTPTSAIVQTPTPLPAQAGWTTTTCGVVCGSSGTSIPSQQIYKSVDNDGSGSIYKMSPTGQIVDEQKECRCGGPTQSPNTSYTDYEISGNRPGDGWLRKLIMQQTYYNCRQAQSDYSCTQAEILVYKLFGGKWCCLK